jgi:hypothetical protein
MRSWSQVIPCKITQRDVQKTTALVTNHNSETETWMEYPNKINLSKTEIDVNRIKINSHLTAKTRCHQYYCHRVETHLQFK